MDQHSDSHNWYDTNAAKGWYNTASASAPFSPAGKGKAPSKKRRRLKITMLSLSLVVLIAASVLAFAPRKEAPPSGEAALPPATQEYSLPEGFEDFFPEGSDPAQYDDFHEFFSNYFTEADPVTGSNLEKAPLGSGVTLSLESSTGLKKLSLQEVYARGEASVVGIRASKSEEEMAAYAWGTGIIMTADGYILTNTHVISDANYCTVILSDGREFDALLVADDTQSDIAVLKIAASDLPAASFGDSSQLQVGDEVVAIGNPLGMEFSGTVTNGIISGINRGIVSNGHTMTLLQTNAALNEGNSGGPLFNMYGQVIGITNMKMAANYTQVTIEGIGFAIPSASAKTVVDQLIEKGLVSGRPGIGITVGSVPASAAQQWDLPFGLYIMEVVERSDAYAKGIRPGDILMAVNQTKVYTTDDVNLLKEGFDVGDTLTFSIFRKGESFDVEVALVDMNELY